MFENTPSGTRVSTAVEQTICLRRQLVDDYLVLSEEKSEENIECGCERKNPAESPETNQQTHDRSREGLQVPGDEGKAVSRHFVQVAKTQATEVKLTIHGTRKS